MTPTEIRAAVHGLRTQGHGLREISRLLAMSRNTVRRILREPAGDAGGEPPPCDEATLVRLKAAFARARGNVVRVRELLADEGLEVPYSTLTRWVRDAELRGPPRRAGEYDFAPGQEMQHDTSPHRVRLGQAGKPVTLQCAGLVLAYSRRLFIQYYPRFTRFEARAFLLEAARFMAGVCPVCIIDNTSVLLAAGAGADAVIAPEMAAFARTLGFGFRAPGGQPGSQRPDRTALRLCRDEFSRRPELRRSRRPQRPGARLVPGDCQPETETHPGYVARGGLCLGEAASTTAAACAATGV